MRPKSSCGEQDQEMTLGQIMAQSDMHARPKKLIHPPRIVKDPTSKTIGLAALKSNEVWKSVEHKKGLQLIIIDEMLQKTKWTTIDLHHSRVFKEKLLRSGFPIVEYSLSTRTSSHLKVCKEVKGNIYRRKWYHCHLPRNPHRAPLPRRIQQEHFKYPHQTHEASHLSARWTDFPSCKHTKTIMKP